jgi:hypothetical protein
MKKIVYLTNEQWQYMRTLLKSKRETDKKRIELAKSTTASFFNALDAK